MQSRHPSHYDSGVVLLRSYVWQNLVQSLEGGSIRGRRTCANYVDTPLREISRDPYKAISSISSVCGHCWVGESVEVGLRK